MALSRPPAYEGTSLPTSQARSGPNEAPPIYSMDQQQVPGSYGGHYSIQGPQRGGYQGPPNEPWIERVLDEMKDMLLLLTPLGRITYATPSCKHITGRAPKQLEGSLLSQYIHEDDQSIFQRDLDDSVAANQSFRTHIRFQKAGSTYCLMEAYGHPHIANQDERQGGGNTPIHERCTGFFLMCRPYPNRISQLLDSFLEHKIENARLIQQIAKLKQEEDEEATAARASYSKGDSDRRAPLADTHGQHSAPGEISSDPDTTDTVAPNSDESDTSQSTDSYREPNTSGAYSHIDGIEIMTGLNYADGERSQGLSTGLSRGRLVHCDIDITTAADQERTAQEGDRRKRLKAQHVCGDCGTADSPEWRKGPNGPKTLCNACGLRWSKKEKKRQESA